MSNGPSELLAMSECLHHERIAVLGTADGDKRELLLMMWASACVQEALTVWRTLHPQMEIEMLAELMKTARR